MTLSYWSSIYFVASITVFFGVPLAVLVFLYSIITIHLMSNTQAAATSAIRYRRQVVLMLGAVVLSFFVCLLPFRAFTLCIIIAPVECTTDLGPERYYNLLYFSRIMLYLNSAVNPILYNLMSTKFRDGFRRLLGIRLKGDLGRKGTITTTTTLSSSSRKSSSDHLLRRTIVRMYSAGRDSSCNVAEESYV